MEGNHDTITCEKGRGHVRIGDVATFPDVKPDKEQVMKVSEETLEVFSAWEKTCKRDCVGVDICGCANSEHLVDECADLIQAVANLLAAIGVNDMTDAMESCRKRNEKRGRFGKDMQ